MSEILGEAVEFDLGSGTIVVVPTEKSPVTSVNGKTGPVELNAEDVGALPDSEKTRIDAIAENVDRMKFHNLLSDYPASEFTNGITFAPTDDGGVRVSGTAAGDSFYNFYHNMSAIPSNLRIGKTYRAHYDGSSNVKFHFWFYKDGNYFSGYTIAGDRDDLVIPDGINGMVIRLSVDSGVTVNEVVHPRIVSGLANDVVLSRTAQYPPLTAGQKSEILNLISEYEERKNGITYDYDSTMLYFLDASDTYDSENKVRLCCDTFAELVWGGVSPDTFPAAGGDYTANIVKAFSWGYFASHMVRQRTFGLAQRDGGTISELYGYRAIDENTKKSYSYNTRYSASGDLPHSQRWLGGLGASDLANELYLGGYEIPASEADAGDLVFYQAPPYAAVSENNSTYNLAFRQIFHVAVITKRINGFFEVAEVTSEDGGNGPVVRRSIFSNNDYFCARSGYMQRYAIMFARHPAAYGVLGNVPSQFQDIPTRLNG